MNGGHAGSGAPSRAEGKRTSVHRAIRARSAGKHLMNEQAGELDSCPAEPGSGTIIENFREAQSIRANRQSTLVANACLEIRKSG